ncbi:MAG: MBL fold metallo-hydrolase [Dehalococcoidia bacterium]
MQVSPSVRAVQVPDENPMHPQFTSIYVVGRGQVLTIDSGEAVDRYRWMLRGYLAATERAEVAQAALTHHHLDHAGNLKWVHENLKADILVPPDAVPLIQDQLPDSGVSTLHEGQRLDLGDGVVVQVLMTPGHSVDSVCYYLEEEGVLFSGDTLLGSSTTTVHDLADYYQSLHRLLALPNLSVICPGHGPLVHDPRERLQSYIDHREQRERQILTILAEGGEKTSWDIMLRLYTDIDPRLRRAADGNVRTHLAKLQKEGRLSVYEGVRKQPDEEQRAKQEEEAKRRAEVKGEAEKLAAEERRALLYAQENPPTEEWAIQPRYELVGAAEE